MNNVWTWLLWIVGTMLLGGLGSGTWEKLLKPLFEWTYNRSTGWMRTKMDGVYAHMAQRRSYEQQNAVSYVVLLALTIILLELYLRTFDPFIPDVTISFIAEHIKHIQLTVTDKAEAAKQIKEYLDKLKAMGSLVLALAFTNVWYQFIKKYVVAEICGELTADYDRLLVMARPWLSDTEYHAHNFRFAIMRCKADYIEIMKKLLEDVKRGKPPTESPQ